MEEISRRPEHGPEGQGAKPESHRGWLFFFFFFLQVPFKIFKIYLFFAMLGLCCCEGFSLVEERRWGQGGTTLHVRNSALDLQWFVLLQSMGSKGCGL